MVDTDSRLINSTSWAANVTNNEQIVSVCSEMLHVIQIVNNVTVSGIVCFLGIIFNLISLIIFLKQKIRNTVNISMLAITVSDLCSLITLEWLNINLNPFMENADVPFEPSEIQYLTGGWPHACFLQITIWITVYVTAERFTCIALPLKVKQIFTTFRTKVVISVIYVLMLLSLSPEYATMYFGEKFYPERNKTRVGLKARSIRSNLEDVVYMLFAVMGIVSFIVLILVTYSLVVTLKRKSQWRRRSTAYGEKSQDTSNRDIKAMKMVGLIATVLVICAAPGMILSIAVVITPELSSNCTSGDVVRAIWSFAFLAEAMNSTIGIVFFYKMSSNYRSTFHALMSRCKTCNRASISSERVMASNR